MLRIEWESLARDVLIARTLQKQSQERFAHDMGCSLSTIRRLEKGLSVSAEVFMAACVMVEQSPAKYIVSTN